MAGQATGTARRPLAVPVLVTVGVLLSLGAFFQLRIASRETEMALMERQALQLHDALKERIDNHILLLRALSGPLAGPAPVTQASFATAAEPLLPQFPSLRAVGWARRIAPTQVPLLERAMRADGRPTFAVRHATDGIALTQPAADQGRDLFVNVLVEPRRAGDALIGLDIATLPGRRDLLARACRSGGITAADASPLPGQPVAAVHSTIVFYLPVYLREAEPDGDAPGCDLLSGYLWSAFGLDQLLKEVTGRVRSTSGDVYLVDLDAAGGPQVIAAEPRFAVGGRFRQLDFQELSGVPTINRAIAAGGRRWSVVLATTPSPLFDGGDGPAWAVFAMGLLLTAGLARYVHREAVAKRLLQTEARARAAMARALRESEERFRMALRHSHIALFSQDRDLRYVWVYSPQTFHMAEELIGRTHADVYGAADAAKLDTIKRTVLETGAGSRHEVPLTVGGRVLVFDLIVEPMRDDRGAVCGVVSAAIDITEATRIRQALAEAHAEAERANQAKSRFLAAASHDLRQPFQAMSLFHHILMSRLEDPKQIEIAGKLGEALAAGNALLGTLLDTSALEAGTVKPRPMDFAFQDIAARLATEIADQAAGKGLTLRVVPTSALVHSDPVLLERMIRNLLVNALRYTVEGRILLGCRHRGDRLSIEVWDTGPGIPEDQMERIFEDFYRCGTDRRDSTRGLGLGLSIVRRTAEILDHSVHVRSRVGSGTMFAIVVPLADGLLGEDEPSFPDGSGDTGPGTMETGARPGDGLDTASASASTAA